MADVVLGRAVEESQHAPLTDEEMAFCERFAEQIREAHSRPGRRFHTRAAQALATAPVQLAT